MDEQVTVTMTVKVTGNIYGQSTEECVAKLVKEALEDEGWENVEVIPCEK